MSCGCKIIGEFTKTPWESLDYPFDYSRVLESGETLSGSSWVTHADLSQDSIGLGASATVVFAGSGIAGKSYIVINRVTTSAGRKFERGIRLNICGITT